MKKLLTALVIIVSLGTAGSVCAQDYQKGGRALNSDDYATALREFKPLAERGNSGAQRGLGVMYDKGKGVVQDKKEAVKWYRKGAEQGDSDAQHLLAWYYKKGEGVIQDNVYAHMWFNIAASNGTTAGAFSRDIMAKRMTAGDISKAQELARVCVAKKYKGC